jgi:signal transduction histidine kinase
VRDIYLLKLHDIFLRKFIVLFTSFFIILGIVFYFWIKELYIEQTKIDLLNNIDILLLQIKTFEDLDKKVKKIKKLTNIRVTIVDDNGIVIAESDKDKSTMDNHANRNEIIESKYQEYGDTIRYSNTLQKELLYVSKRYTINSKKYYIRMARDIEFINQKFYSIILKVSVVFFIFISISFLIALKISEKLRDETNYILEFLKCLMKQKKASKINSEYSYEFNKITKHLTALSEDLAKKDKQKSKYTAKLKLSNRQKDEIISAISHEFKNPIAVISGYSQTLLEDKDINSNIRDKFLEKISSNGNKMTKMIDRLRLITKLEDGKQENKFKEVNLKVLVQNQIDDLQDSYSNAQIELDCDDIYKEVDETLFSIAVINLIENAIKYSQDTVNITITDKKLSVIDTGIGINKKDIEKVTQKFYRISKNEWNNSLGIGLSLVTNIVKNHNFKLEIESTENEGSTFSIVF